MNKRSYFSFLKPGLCFLFFANSVAVFGMKTVKEPDKFKNVVDKGFYVEHDEEQNLYFRMECITKENVGRWEEMLAYESYKYFELKRFFDPKFDPKSTYDFYIAFFKKYKRIVNFWRGLKEIEKTIPRPGVA